MARPIRRNLLDFTHDADAPGNKKFKALRQHYGGGDHGRAMEQRFWQLNCLIAKADGCRLDLTRLYVRSSLIEDLDLPDKDFDEFIGFLSDPDRCRLLVNQAGVIWTERLQEELAIANESRESERRRKETERDKRRQHKDRVVTPLSGGKPSLSRGSPEENGSFPPDSPRTETVVRGTLLSSPFPSLPVQSGGEEPPPLSASPPEPQEKVPYTFVDNRIPQEATPMMMELQEIYRKATHGETLKLSDDEMSALLSLFRRRGGPDVIAAYRLHQEKKPGKAFAYFLADFGEYVAKAPKPPAPPPAQSEIDKVEKAGLIFAARESKKAGIPLLSIEKRALQEIGEEPPDPGPPPDTFDDDFPEAAGGTT